METRYERKASDGDRGKLAISAHEHLRTVSIACISIGGAGVAYSLLYGHSTERAHGFPSDDSTDLKPPYNFHMANQGINGGAEREE